MIQARPPLFTQQRAKGFGPGTTRSRRRLSLRGTPSGNRHGATFVRDLTLRFGRLFRNHFQTVCCNGDAHNQYHSEDHRPSHEVLLPYALASSILHLLVMSWQ